MAASRYENCADLTGFGGWVKVGACGVSVRYSCGSELAREDSGATAAFSAVETLLSQASLLPPNQVQQLDIRGNKPMSVKSAHVVGRIVGSGA